MKNKKIFTITIAVIALIAGAMLVCSKAIEKAWTTPENTRNNLTANSENITTVETSFDYPYICVTPADLGFNENDKEKMKDCYLVDAEYGYKGSVPYQQVANTVGELLKDIYGYTACQKEPIHIALFEIPQPALIAEWMRGTEWADKHTADTYLSMKISSNSNETQEPSFVIYIEPYTGKAITLSWGDPQDAGPHIGVKYKLSDKEAHSIFDNEIETLMNLMGNTAKIQDIEFLNAKMRGMDDEDTNQDYYFAVHCEDGMTHTFGFSAESRQLTNYENATEFWAHLY